MNNRLIYSLSLFVTLQNVVHCYYNIVTLRSLDIGKPFVFQVDVGASLFLASIDNLDFLKNVLIENGANKATADTLLGNNNDGSIKPWDLVDGNLTLTNNNNIEDTKQLYGYFYVTYANQTKDSNFVVFVAEGNRTIDRNTFNESTIVVLNLQQNTYFGADFNAIVRNIVQPSTTKMSIRQSFPSRYYKDSKDVNSADNTIFRNPFPSLDHLEKTSLFFDHIETLQIPVRIWYVYSLGGIKLDVEGNWMDPAIFNTTAITTTGLLVNENHGMNKTINFMLNPANNRTIGNYWTSAVFANITLIWYSSSGMSTFQEFYSEHNAWVNGRFCTYMQAYKLEVISDRKFDDNYFGQYFGIDGNVLPTTIFPPSVSTTTVIPTTTGSASGFSINPTILCLFIIGILRFLCE